MVGRGGVQIIGAPVRCRVLESAQLSYPQISVWLPGRLGKWSKVSERGSIETLHPPREVLSAPSKRSAWSWQADTFRKSAVIGRGARTVAGGGWGWVWGGSCRVWKINLWLIWCPPVPPIRQASRRHSEAATPYSCSSVEVLSSSGPRRQPSALKKGYL